MKTKNKMKESKAKSKEWWEVTKEYFLKELEKNMAQHRKNEKKLRYKLETYQKKNLDFIYYNPTSIKALN
jgi:CHAD domain-containing protein